MRYRRTPRKRGPLPLRKVLFFTSIFFIFMTLAGIWLVNTAIEPTLMKYAESETKKMATTVINHAIDKTISNKADINGVIKEVPKEEGSTGIQFDTERINRIRAEITLLVQKQLNGMEEGNVPLSNESNGKHEENTDGIIYRIPLGKATNNALLGNLGPKIPVELNAISDAQSDVKTTMEPFGINNAMIKVFLRIEVHAQVIIPFSSKPTKIITTVPIAMRVVTGDVPTYFNGNGSGGNPAITLPAK